MNRPLLALLAATAFASVPASADEMSQTDQAPPCGLLCKVWRNVSGRVKVPVPLPVAGDGYENSREPTAEDDARRPDVNRLVVVHGDILKTSAAERAKQRSAVALQEKRFDAMRKEQTSAGLQRPAPSGTQ